MHQDKTVSEFFESEGLDLLTQDIEPLPERSGSICLCYLLKYNGMRFFLKRLRPDYAGNLRYEELLNKEFEVGSNCQHPNLVHYVTKGQDDQGIYIVTAYVDGDTLQERLLSQPDYFASPNHLTRFFTQLLNCLSYMHHHQVLYLDLKPDNVMITRIGNDVRLLDLGFCYHDSFYLSMGRNSLYSAPEQLEGKMDQINVCSDIYAVGRMLQDICLMYPSVYGGKEILHVVERSTCADPAQRYESAEEMGRAIRKALSSQKRRVPRRSFKYRVINVIIMMVMLAFYLASLLWVYWPKIIVYCFK